MDPVADSAAPAAAAVPSIVPAEVMAAASIDGQASAPAVVPAAAAAPAAQAIDFAAEAADLVEFAHALFTPIYPSLVPIYTSDVRGRISAVLAPLMSKYDLSLGRFGPELLAAVTIVPLIVPTVRAVRADRAADQSGRSAEIPNVRSVEASDVRSTVATIEKSNVTIEKTVESPLSAFPQLNADSTAA